MKSNDFIAKSFYSSLLFTKTDKNVTQTLHKHLGHFSIVILLILCILEIAMVFILCSVTVYIRSHKKKVRVQIISAPQYCG